MKTPNVLLILTDQWPHNFFGRYGLPVPTPNTDKLAAEGTVFTNAFTTCPLCSPARGTLLTARWPCQTGMLDNPGGGYSMQTELDPSEKTWIEGAAESGYHVGYFGKWHLGPDGPIRRGAHRHSATFEPNALPYDPVTRPYSYDDMEKKYAAWAQSQLEYGVPAFYGRSKKSEEQSSAFRLANDAREFFDEVASTDMGPSTGTGQIKPFFLTVSFQSPHFPHYLPDRFADLAESLDVGLPANFGDEFIGKPSHHGKPWWPSMDTSRFDEAEWKRIIAYSMAHIAMTDEAIGRVLDSLESSGLANNTTVIFTSDHGDTCGAHNRFDKGAYFYDEVWRIPLTIKRPGQLPTEQDAFVSLIDLGRTLFEMTGAAGDRERPLMGRDLRSLLDGRPNPDFPGQAFGTYDLYNGMSFAVRSIRDRRHKYVWNPQAIDELYDLESDPHELVNRINDETLRDVSDRLRDQLLQWMVSIGDDLPVRAAGLPDAGTVLATGKPGP